MMENGVPLHEPRRAGRKRDADMQLGGEHSLGDSQAASYARVYDVSVMGRPGNDRGDPRMTTLEAAIFESGRPVLLAPPSQRRVGETIVIPWNPSTETARAVSFAMPMLLEEPRASRAKRRGCMVDGPPGELKDATPIATMASRRKR